jgi:hypothetical protein
MDLSPLAEIELRLHESLGSQWDSVLNESYPEVYRKLNELRLAYSSLEFIRSDRDLKLIGFSVWQEQKKYFEELVSKSLDDLRAAISKAGLQI